MRLNRRIDLEIELSSVAHISCGRVMENIRLLILASLRHTYGFRYLQDTYFSEAIGSTLGSNKI
jgi:hypothetical protein